MTPDAVLLDTSFFLRFLNEADPLYSHADGYFKYFIQNGVALYVSTISIAEYCTGGSIDELPLRNLKILPFNLQHAKRAGELAAHVHQSRKKDQLRISSRLLIPNDTKLFAQSDIEPDIKYYLSSDTESLKVFKSLDPLHPKFNFIDLHNNYQTTFGILM